MNHHCLFEPEGRGYTLEMCSTFLATWLQIAAAKGQHLGDAFLFCQSRDEVNVFSILVLVKGQTIPAMHTAN